MMLEIRTADELIELGWESRWRTRRAARETPLFRQVLRLFLAEAGPIPVAEGRRRVRRGLSRRGSSVARRTGQRRPDPDPRRHDRHRLPLLGYADSLCRPSRERR
jgi:hypothetical protein